MNQKLKIYIKKDILNTHFQMMKIQKISIFQGMLLISFGIHSQQLFLNSRILTLEIIIIQLTKLLLLKILFSILQFSMHITLILKALSQCILIKIKKTKHMSGVYHKKKDSYIQKTKNLLNHMVKYFGYMKMIIVFVFKTLKNVGQRFPSHVKLIICIDLYKMKIVKNVQGK